VTNDEAADVAPLIAAENTTSLLGRLQALHRQVLSPAGLLVPGRREQIETLCSLIRAELARRETR
jgi:hypothetical protein